MGLFALVIGGGMVATYQIIESTNAINQKVITFEEASFVLNKINWALNGATTVTDGATSMTVNGVTFALNGDNLNLGASPLNNSYVKIAQVPGVSMFVYDSTAKKLDISLTVNGQRFDETRYLH